MGRHDFWIHGVAAWIDVPYVGTTRYTGWGTGHQQAAGANTLYLALPVPTIIDGDEDVAITKVHVNASTTDDAEITSIEVWTTGDEPIAARAGLHLHGPDKRESVRVGEKYLDLPGIPARPPEIQPADGPLSVAVKVEFSGPAGGEVILHGAGVSYDE